MSESKQPTSIDSERTWPQKGIRALGYTALGVVFGTPIAATTFVAQSTTTEIAAHQITVSPSMTGDVLIKNSIADIRDSDSPLPGPFGLDITVGNNLVPSQGSPGNNSETAYQLFGAVAAQPEGEIAKLSDVLRHQLLVALGSGIVAGGALAEVVHRRRQLIEGKSAIRAGAVALTVSAVGGVITQVPSEPTEAPVWFSAQEVLNIPGAELPDSWEIRDNLISGTARDLIGGGARSYSTSRETSVSMADNLVAAADLIRVPEEDEVSYLLISDRHDNISMDPVLDRVGELGRASYLINLGDNTSSGGSWEAFSLRSLDETFNDYDGRYSLIGNHDHGPVVGQFLENHDFTMPSGEPQEFGPLTVFGVNDPRQSDFTPTRSEPGVSYEETVAKLTDAVCESEDRINLVITPKSSMGSEILEEGCSDFVVGGDTHTYSAPMKIESENGSGGYSMTVGTSGGAAFAIAFGSKPRRPANAVLLTVNQSGTPVGTQSVDFLTTGKVVVNDFIELEYTDLEAEESDSGVSLGEKKTPDATP